NIFKLIFVFLALSGVVNSAKILIVFNAVSKSHHILGDALAIGLAEKGHEVLMVSPFKSSFKHANYKEILLDGDFSPDIVKKKMGNLFEIKKKSFIDSMKTISGFGMEMAKGTLYHPKMVDLLNSNATFDAVIVEVFLNECLLGLAQHYDAIPIMMGTAPAMIWSNKMVGNPSNPAYDISVFSSFSNPMSYWQRFGNTVFSVVGEFFHWLHLRAQHEVYDSYFRPIFKQNSKEFPHLSTLVTNVSLVLLNSNIAVSGSQAIVPNMVNVGGLHVKPDTLPDDLQKVLDNSKQGVIYFSMGSNLKSSELPQEKRDAILNTFAKLKETVLWKWEDDKLPNQPKNVVIRSWMPQQAILNHKNVKVFITHGGLLSSIESIYFGVPLVGIPIFGDQRANMARATRSGYGVQIDLDDINEETLSELLNKVLKNPSYRSRSQYLSKIFRDEPQPPLEKAVNSIEYVLRHKGAHFLRSPAAGMPVYQTWLLDVAAGFLMILVFVILIIVLALKLTCGIFRCIFKSKSYRREKED
ncbi:2-hydroxyacylsphingosine 1-beta-galactosyltransferase-like, partial [Ctenocephalides felis]|uniref:2-hydroxyacylsphingosine 1-beta-galactosyltransferase-like n=1 Tax=Ctenocephalides felis TaxID=7515 RepID=UPI000E6E59E1